MDADEPTTPTTPTTGMAALLTLARSRHGAFHLRRCADVGVKPATVRNRARREGWERPHPATLCLPGSVDGWWRTTSALQEAIGPDPVLAGRTAAFAHGILRTAPVRTELLRPHGLHRPQWRLVKVTTSRTLREEDIEVVGGLRCTTWDRTLQDLAAVLRVDPLRSIAIEALWAGAFELGVLTARIASMPPGEPRRRLEEVAADLARVTTDSPFAYDVLEAVRALGIEIEGEFPWRCPDGRIQHFDGAVADAWVAVECDGRGKYAAGSSFTTDRVRWTQASGSWRCVWVTWQRWLDDRAGVLSDVRRAVDEADRSRAAATRAACSCRRCRRR